jgi:hypothetical protein
MASVFAWHGYKTQWLLSVQSIYPLRCSGCASSKCCSSQCILGWYFSLTSGAIKQAQVSYPFPTFGLFLSPLPHRASFSLQELDCILYLVSGNCLLIFTVHNQLYIVRQAYCSVILSVRTRSVDLTIANILEGAVTFVPRMDSLQSVSPVNTMAQESKNIPSTSTVTHMAASTVQVIYFEWPVLPDTEFLFLCLNVIWDVRLRRWSAPWWSL